MVLVKNRKPSRVGLPKKNGGTMFFEPGTHECDEDDLGDLNTDSKAVRAYLEGDDPVLSIIEDGQGKPDPTPSAKKPAVEVKEMIAESNDPEFLRRILHTDDRTTVIAAADARLAELQAGVNAGGGDDGAVIE